MSADPRLVVGRHRLDSVIGSGGMGRVDARGNLRAYGAAPTAVHSGRLTMDRPSRGQDGTNRSSRPKSKIDSAYRECALDVAHHRHTITVRLDRRAYSPVLRQATLPTATPVPWWGNRTLRCEFA